MADAHTILSTILYCLWWPTNRILFALGFILSPFWAVAKFVFLPVAYLLHGIYVI
ncbi:uncharacterized protein N0V89_005810 [Didymosphaeria variabile]|uniref:Uncharacterized protein n=1 Tax=Didymosphaeria variabile TaxID=1932322 RepID=A0A9W8XP78_9PLEO|nr:uncharacterized protein N0V89_005810 [Didymosphaeria variabile]KAJ4354077.1 hypothetical protein N0V89_005810 [Didymosphaeria variabile]